MSTATTGRQNVTPKRGQNCLCFFVSHLKHFCSKIIMAAQYNTKGHFPNPSNTLRKDLYNEFSSRHLVEIYGISKQDKGFFSSYFSRLVFDNIR